VLAERHFAFIRLVTSRPRDHPDGPERQFAANLRQRRLERGLTQRELGQAAGLHSTEVSRLERAEVATTRLDRSVGSRPRRRIVMPACAFSRINRSERAASY
jgi:hypothetical protein